ncbi:hypothetical protein [Weissella cibaria]|uniref:hypothetical protein n=1 Tax=Weissella cibaria TaxID=137591 RepID=UPI0005C304A4|nr:hypothetical protein [Weissella cibaria]KIU22170.1 hypothetical protein ff3pr_01620 [Weissella cibaria]MBD1502792.1 hypothetical protein [Weissella cibaria]MCG4286542.1 hypothetical protein [Weissella cibaria]MDY2520766.1 hypothetical protein [Weissella cibaria]WCE25662.1 hypothetical protein PKU16_03510 [Weissella cibaria]
MTDANLDERLNQYLHVAPVINDYVVSLDLHEFEGEKPAVVSYDESSRTDEVEYRILRTGMVGKLQLELPTALLSYHR